MKSFKLIYFIDREGETIQVTEKFISRENGVWDCLRQETKFVPDEYHLKFCSSNEEMQNYINSHGKKYGKNGIVLVD